jgi:hypothetical protein
MTDGKVAVLTAHLFGLDCFAGLTEGSSIPSTQMPSLLRYTTICSESSGSVPVVGRLPRIELVLASFVARALLGLCDSTPLPSIFVTRRSRGATALKSSRFQYAGRQTTATEAAPGPGYNHAFAIFAPRHRWVAELDVDGSLLQTRKAFSSPRPGQNCFAGATRPRYSLEEAQKEVLRSCPGPSD